jgi:hypothetical protein
MKRQVTELSRPITVDLEISIASIAPDHQIAEQRATAAPVRRGRYRPGSSVPAKFFSHGRA